ncbi:hypothetical protein [Pelotalea chapellei]|uniref:Uncharacterized protein n=1 Tax=Pelotalea chapellei TaxID=44671 RepID=A0ABS5U9V7_9BACT|nr:hypothetical protein [Pelotalea chapellei]MBT1072447.1 hypothetical protein [Pelotalea chapellei]
MSKKILSGIILIAFGYIFIKIQTTGNPTNLFDKILGSLIPTMVITAGIISNRSKYRDFYLIDYIVLVVVSVIWVLGTLLAVDKMFGLSFMR